jgi:hypothetical protein
MGRTPAGMATGMSQSEQEKAADAIGVPAVPGHHGGPPPVDGPDDTESSEAADEVASGHPNKVEPRAGRDR